MTLSSRLPPHERRRLEAVAGADLEDLARRRLQGEPLQYLEGTAAFLDFEVDVDERVLVPRPETEGLFDLARREVAAPQVVVDLGTGSGVLAIAAARAWPAARVHAVDLSAAALGVAAANARRHRVEVAFHWGDLYTALPASLRGRVELILSNPPYVADHEWEGLPADVRREPRSALVAGRRGTEVAEVVVAGAEIWLAPGGLLACEIGETQGPALLASAPTTMTGIRIETDLAGRQRYLLWRRA